MFKCECKMVRKFALETENLMHILYPTGKANKFYNLVSYVILSHCDKFSNDTSCEYIYKFVM